MPKRKIKRIALRDHVHKACIIDDAGARHCGTLLGEAIKHGDEVTPFGGRTEVDTYDGYPSINVKALAEGAQEKMPWEQTVEIFRDDAQDDVQEYAETVFKGRKPIVGSAGRFGKHLIVRGIGVPEDWDSDALERWEYFEKTIEDILRDIASKGEYAPGMSLAMKGSKRGDFSGPEDEEDEEEIEDDEDLDDEEEFDLGSEMETGVIISEDKHGLTVSSEGKIICEFQGDDAMEDALDAIDDWMEKHKYYPNIFYVNERGNTDLIDQDGNILRSWT